jgi:hypothetical protein
VGSKALGGDPVSVSVDDDQRIILGSFTGLGYVSISSSSSGSVSESDSGSFVALSGSCFETFKTVGNSMSDSGSVSDSSVTGVTIGLSRLVIR